MPKIIERRLTGYFKDVALLDQAAVWEDKKSVGAVLDANNTKVVRFARFAVGA